MKVLEKNVMRLLAVQHLRTAYGIKTKNWNKNKAASCKTTTSSSVSKYNIHQFNLLPAFLVDACIKLLAHVDTEGLFRKSGSVVRLKALRAKLDAGEECLSNALPCDVAGLVKQFFRELPEPVLPIELQEVPLFFLLDYFITFFLPLHYCLRFFSFFFLCRSAENKMDSSNLSVILAPNLLHFGDSTEKINANTEKRLKLQATVVHCFIENAHSFGTLPQFLQEKVPAMMGCESGGLSPNHDEVEDLDLNSEMKKKRRRSFGDMVNGALNKIKTNRTPTRAPQSDIFSSATPVIATPSSKRKLPLESGHSFGFSNKKRRSVKKNLGMDLLPNTLFNGTSTPGSGINSASGALDSSQNILSSAGRFRRQSASSVRRKSRRLILMYPFIFRVESVRAGCFSPKVSKKEAPRKSLRLRFSLGKGSKDAVSGSESIGWRLASQESTTSFRFTKETDFSPSVLPRKAESKGECQMCSLPVKNFCIPV
uniref:Rho-GAP domain-containing protein n=1 Tax=Mola mola TaxID=94237 RepID=A0A3Q3W1X9_MOLML